MHKQITMRQAYLRSVFSHKRMVFFAIASGFLFGFILFSLSNMTVILSDLKTDAATIHIFTIIILSLLFGINAALLRERITQSRGLTGKAIGSTSIASGLGILFSGCASCGLTLASYVGLGSVATFLPWSGVEIDILAIVLLGYSIWKLSEPASCKIVPQHSSKTAK